MALSSLFLISIGQCSGVIDIIATFLGTLSKDDDDHNNSDKKQLDS